ncbi:MAG: hypothetical protein QOF62_2112 [Pyrinomonadaceae bacterium]|jgi:tetratricopeptide (TPR) repeat protein/CHAT domain-containing protein|nr:hypothetical protein [Pyrinomonadaceae bacterium]
MDIESFVNCGTCGHPIQLSLDLQSIEFPDDDELLIQFYEGRLNVIECPVCKNKIPLGTPLLVTNTKQNSTIIVIPDEQRAKLEELVTELPDDFNIEYCSDYPALYRAMVPWFNDEVVPVMKMILTNKFYDQPMETQIEQLSPFFLRVFKSEVDGTLMQPILRLTGSPAKQKEWVEGIYDLIVTGLIRQLLEWSVNSREIHEMNSLVRERIPSKCITDNVLSTVLGYSMGFKDPWSDSTDFRKGFLRAYLNSIVHSHAGKENPEGDIWATYLYCVWKLGQDESVTLDTQLVLPGEVIRQTVAFPDLWNVTATADNLDKSDDRMAIMTDRLEMMKAFGFQAEFEETFLTLPIGIDAPTDDPVAEEKLSASFVSVTLKHYPFNTNPDQSIEMGRIVGGHVTVLLNNGLKDVAMSVAKEMLDRSVASGDHFAAISIGARVVEGLNNAQEFAQAVEITSPLLSLLDDDAIHNALGASQPSLMMDFFNEVGNVMRHWHEYDLALKMYSFAEDIYEIIPEEKRDLHSISVLNRNRALVYRDMGSYKRAKTLLDAELAQHPNDPSRFFNLVMLNIRTNNFPEALKGLNQIIAMIADKKPTIEWSDYFLCRAELGRTLGNAEEGLQDLIRAYDIASVAKSNRSLRIAALAMRFRSDEEQGREFIQKCLRTLLAALGDKERRSDPTLIVTIVTQIAERYLEEGNAHDFVALFQPEFEWLEGWNLTFPWQYDYVRGWLAYELGDTKAAWLRLESAANKIDERVPQAEDVSFSPTWMHDKERFQQRLSSVAIELVRQHDLPNTELLKVYELTNGREIAARLGVSFSPEEIISGIGVIAEKTNRSIQVFFPLVEEKTVHLCCLSSDSRHPKVLDQGRWDRDELHRMRKQTYHALKQANPADLSVLDRRMRSWNEFSLSFGKAIAPHVGESDHVCILPGRDLTGLPLHLVQLPCGISLLERNTVTYAPNFAMLFAPHNTAPSKSIAIVTVTKRRDSERFRDRANNTSNELVDLFQNWEVHELNGLDASASRTLDLVQRVSELVFICHGAYAGTGRGYGVCVSDGHQLPPSLFPIAEVPELERFVLTWDDFEEVASCPDVVISIACSSGLTEVVPGGTRYGLEQTLFGHGTRALISPLWDIDQESGLDWVTTFCRAQSQNPKQWIEETYRETALAHKERFPHQYFWGSFTLNGSLFSRGDHDE